MAGTMAKEMIDLLNDCFYGIDIIIYIERRIKLALLRFSLCLFHRARKFFQAPEPPLCERFFSCACLRYAVAVKASQGVRTVDPHRGQAKRPRRDMVMWE
jgi:hypothetical protein